MVITYSAFAKKTKKTGPAIIFMKPRGAIAHQRLHDIRSVKEKKNLYQTSRCVSCNLLPSKKIKNNHHHPPSLQWPTCDHVESESHCVVDTLLTAAVHLMYRCTVLRWCQLGPQKTSCSLCPEEGEVSAGQPWKRKLSIWGHTYYTSKQMGLQ